MVPGTFWAPWRVSIAFLSGGLRRLKVDKVESCEARRPPACGEAAAPPFTGRVPAPVKEWSIDSLRVPDERGIQVKKSKRLV